MSWDGDKDSKSKQLSKPKSELNRKKCVWGRSGATSSSAVIMASVSAKEVTPMEPAVPSEHLSQFQHVSKEGEKSKPAEHTEQHTKHRETARITLNVLRLLAHKSFELLWCDGADVALGVRAHAHSRLRRSRSGNSTGRCALIDSLAGTGAAVVAVHGGNGRAVGAHRGVNGVVHGFVFALIGG
jgi:hypothetical protein